MAASDSGRAASGAWVPGAHRETPITALRQLLLLRHAKSSWDDPKLADHERPLSPRGRRTAQAMRRAMRELGLEPDIVLVSSAVRTRQTLDALGPWEEMPLIEVIDGLYLADARRLLAALHEVAETARSVLLVAHNPGIHELALTLLGRQDSGHASRDAQRLAEAYPTAALAEFVIAGPWRTLAEGGGRLTRFLKPKDLPELAA